MGGSVTGLMAALLAARDGHQVTVLDRGRPELPAGPAEAWAAWPWLQQPHALLPGLRRLLRRHFPAVYRALLQAGAVELPGPSGEVALGCRRTTLELQLRRHARTRGLQVEHAATVTGLETRAGQVTAVHATRAASVLRFEADVAIDATGHATRVSRWLPGRVRDHSAGCAMTVWSRFYTAPGLPHLASGVSESATGPGWCWYGFVSDAGTCSLSLARLPSAPPLSEAQFEAAAAAAPFARRLRERSAPAGPVRARRGLHNTLRRCTTPGLLLAGDALLTTNPARGLGMMLAAEHAVALTSVLRTAATPAQASRRWAELTTARYAPLWRQAVTADAQRAQAWRSVSSPAGRPLEMTA